MGRGYWVIRTYIAGAIVEKTKYWLPGEKPTRSKRKLKTEIKKQEQNTKQAERALARVLNANYKTGVLIGLDYDDKSYDAFFGSLTSREEIYKEAVHRAQLCLRRVRREADKLGIEVKAVIVTSDMDGKTGEEKRVHHHIVVNSEAAFLFEKKWIKRQCVNFKPLDSQRDRTALAHYLIAQVYKYEGIKAYTCTRNLIHPEGIDRIAISNARMTVPKGGVLLFASEYAIGVNQYIRYYDPKRDEKFDRDTDNRQRGDTGGNKNKGAC